MADYDRERRRMEEQAAERTRPITPPGDFPPFDRDLGHDSGTADLLFRRRIIYNRIVNVIWTLLGLIEALIGVRVILKLIAANPDNAFVALVYDFSGLFVNPFMGIVEDPTSGNAVLEINSLLAMLVYLILTWALIRIIWLIFDITAPTEPSPPHPG